LKSQTPHTVLQLLDVAVGYKNEVVSSAINFELAAGELMAIVGVNGIGKSTLLRSIGAVQPKLSGAIEIMGKPIAQYSSGKLATKISMVLTEGIVTKNMTVWELVALGRHPHTNWIGSLSSEDNTKIADAIEMLALVELKQKFCFELSDGQLQRVLIARALAQDTPIILLDEPTTHLDLYHKVQILKLLKQIAQERKKAILFTSHEIEMALKICDKLIVLDGRNQSFGSPDFLIQQKAFDTLFPKDTVLFNPETMSFQMKTVINKC